MGDIMEFYFPTEFGERLAFFAAAFTALLGLVVMLAPGMAFAFLGLQTKDGRPEGLAEGRSAGGFLLGISLAALLLAQPMIYLAFGSAVGLAAFGRLLSIMSDRGSVMGNILFLVVQICVAALPLGYVFGFL
ncbi:hypothetical protein SAMN05880593_106155 [Rhizobium sp. RU36D]|nr:hypothetical protein SAMN05880593_106155 [Rhizobium sp. RU36D]